MNIVYSTFLYIFVFSFSIFCTYLAEKNIIKFEYKGLKKRYRSFLFYSSLAILVPSLIAGLRANDVGLDTIRYITNWFQLGKAAISPFAAVASLGTENILYAILGYYCGKFFSDGGILLFLSQLLTIIPIYYCAYYFRKKIPMWAFIGVYLFCFFNNSLNNVKQSIACAFLLLMYCMLIQKKYFKTVFFGIIAILFHLSAIIGVLCVSIITISSKNEKPSIKSIIICFIVVIISLQITELFQFLQQLGLIPQKYVDSVSGILGIKSSNFIFDRIHSHVLFDLIIRWLMFLIPFGCLILIKNNRMRSIMYISMVGVLFYTYCLLRYKTVYGGRISLYFDFFNMIFFPNIVKNIHMKFGNKNVSSWFFWLFLFIYWFGWIMVAGWSASNHYAFRI